MLCHGTGLPNSLTVTLFRLRILILKHHKRVRLLLEQSTYNDQSTVWRVPHDVGTDVVTPWLPYADRPGAQYVIHLFYTYRSDVSPCSNAYESHIMTQWLASRRISYFNEGPNAELPRNVREAVDALTKVQLPSWIAAAGRNQVWHVSAFTSIIAHSDISRPTITHTHFP